MSAKLKIVGLVGAFTLCSLIACKVVDTGDAGQGITTLKIVNNEINEWTEEADGYKRFANLEQVREAINGEADKYALYLDDGFKQELVKGATGRTCRYTVIDCGSDEDATALFNEITVKIGTKTAVGSYALNIAVIDPDYLSGCVVYAHIGRYYTEISPDGFSPKTDANSAGLTFLQTLESKINAM